MDNRQCVDLVQARDDATIFDIGETADVQDELWSTALAASSKLDRSTSR